MKIFVCQTKTLAGNLDENFRIISDLYLESVKLGADICLFPELALSGYGAGDLLHQKGFIKNVELLIERLVSLTEKTCLLIPTPLPLRGKLYNTLIAARDGRIIDISYKKELPVHGIFDEKRYFTSGKPAIITINNIKIGLPICEDIWHPEACMELKEEGAQLFLVANASPYEKGKLQKRINIVKQRFEETNIPMIYCNQVLGQDGIIFDGRSFCYDGELKIIGKDFESDRQIIDFTENKFTPTFTYPLDIKEYEVILRAMTLGVHDYVLHNGFKKVILGLSGGIDSALVAFIAIKALGKENVGTFMLPTKFTSNESIQDARELAGNLGISLDSIDISKIFDSFTETLNNYSAPLRNPITGQNIQSRIRGSILMALANENGALLLTTGNKSEYATGYATIYGDMNGAFNPIKDLYKTEIYALANFINKDENIIPERIITKAPTAELSFNQKDSDSLPEYSILDKILEDHIENDLNQAELFQKYDRVLVEKIINLVKNSEFKRNQSAPGVKISHRAFEKERRYPITNSFK